MGWIRIQYVTPKEIRYVEYGDVPDSEKLDTETDPLHPTKWDSSTGRPKGGHTPEENGE